MTNVKQSGMLPKTSPPTPKAKSVMINFDYPWEIAPSWANWAAFDALGEAHWFAEKPYLDQGFWEYSAGDHHQCEEFARYYKEARNNAPFWQESLRARPDRSMKLTQKERIELASRFVEAALVSAPKTINGCADYLGIQRDEYNGDKHYPAVIAKKCLDFLDAMIEATFNDHV